MSRWVVSEHLIWTGNGHLPGAGGSARVDNPSWWPGVSRLSLYLSLPILPACLLLGEFTIALGDHAKSSRGDLGRNIHQSRGWASTRYDQQEICRVSTILHCFVESESLYLHYNAFAGAAFQREVGPACPNAQSMSYATRSRLAEERPQEGGQYLKATPFFFPGASILIAYMSYNQVNESERVHSALARDRR